MSINKNQIAENDQIFSTDEARKYLKLPSNAALYQIVAKGEIGHLKIGRRLRFLKSDCDKLLTENYVAAGAK